MKVSARSTKHLPLKGIRVLVGRARKQASALSAELRKLGAQVIGIPFIEIRPPRSHALLDAALRNLDRYDWLILTSVNGVDAVWKRLKKLGIAKRKLNHLKIAAIGPATKRAIAARGWEVDVVPQEYVAEAVVKSLRNKVKGKRVLLARAKVARDVIPRELRKLGAQVDVVEAYETVTPARSRVRLRRLMGDSKRRPNLICFTSSSTVRNFANLLGIRGRRRQRHTALETMVFASIGPVTSATLKELDLRADIEAESYTIPGLAQAVACFYTSNQ